MTYAVPFIVTRELQSWRGVMQNRNICSLIWRSKRYGVSIKVVKCVWPPVHTDKVQESSKDFNNILDWRLLRIILELLQVFIVGHFYLKRGAARVLWTCLGERMFRTHEIFTYVMSNIRSAMSGWVANIRMDLGEVGWGDVDWTGLAQDRKRWRALVNSVLNLRVPWNSGKLSSGLTSSGLLSNAQLYRVS
jgi:hypothetical protein